MSTSRRAWLGRLVLLLCIFATARRAGAQGEEPARAAAKAHFERGLVAFEAGTWDAALAEFLESRRLFPTARNTQNAAVCLKRLGRTDEAVDLFREYRKFPLSAADAAAADEEIALLEKQLATVDVSVSETGAMFSLDGRASEPTPLTRPLRVSAGTHMLRAAKDGFATAEKQITVASGQRVAATLVLSPLEQSGRLTVTEDTGAVADVVVDNVVVGRTPFRGSVAPGTHVLFLRGAGNLGSQPAQTRVRLNEVTAITLALEELTALLRVEPTPHDATVALDGVTVANGTWEGRVRKGPHKIEVAREGFVVSARTLQVPLGPSDVKVVLERDLSHPLWANQRPNRFYLEGAVTAPFWIVRGGDTSCDGACIRDLPAGIGGYVGFGYQLRAGLGLGIEASYSYATFGLKRRSVAVERAGGGAPLTGVIDERSHLQALTVGAALHYRWGEVWPVTLRFGAGYLGGTLDENRSGTIETSPTALGPVTESHGVSALYFRPEARLGRTIFTRTDVFGSIAPMLALAFSAPRWSSEQSLPLGNLGFGRFPSERLLGGVSLAVGLQLGITHAF